MDESERVDESHGVGRCVGSVGVRQGAFETPRVVEIFFFFACAHRVSSRLTDETRAGERLRDDVEREIGGRLRERDKRRRSGVRGRVRGIRGGFAVLSNQVRASRRRR